MTVGAEVRWEKTTNLFTGSEDRIVGDFMVGG